MKRKKKDLIMDIIVTTVALILGFIIVFPLFYCFLSSFKTASEFLEPKLFPSSFKYLENFKNALERGNLVRYTLNSFIIAFFFFFFRWARYHYYGNGFGVYSVGVRFFFIFM